MFSSGAFNDDIYKVTDVSIIPDFDILCAAFLVSHLAKSEKMGFSDNLDDTIYFLRLKNIEVKKTSSIYQRMFNTWFHMIMEILLARLNTQ